MKLYDYAMAPNPRRVRIFIAEKGLDIERETVDLSKLEQFEGDFSSINPRACVPALVLDDNTLLTESIAICRYLEDLHPEPALFGTGALDKARIEMWNRRAELEGLQAAAEGVRNSVPFFADRALPGTESFAQIPELGERGRRRTELFYTMLDAHLQDSAFLAGERFSVADITALVACDFARILKIRVGDATPHLKRWYESVSARPSAAA